MLSNLLLTEIRTWNKVEIPNILYHGCRENDIGINIKDKIILGNKWFSKDKDTASNYALKFHMRITSKAAPIILEAVPDDVIFAIKRPSRFDGGEWADF